MGAIKISRYEKKFFLFSQNISPGFVKTEFFSASGYDMPDIFKDIAHLNPEDLADAVVYALSAPSNVNVS